MLKRCRGVKSIHILGDNIQLQNLTFKLYLSSFEVRLNFIISLVISFENKSIRTAKKVKKRQKPHKLLSIAALFNATQCPECAERDDVNRYDETIAIPIEGSEIRSDTLDKVKSNEIEYRLHNLSKCRLPKSRNFLNKK